MAIGPVKIKVLTGPQGGGKSKVMREEAIATPGRYLFALPTHELIDEQVADFFKAAPFLETQKVYAQPNKGKTAERLTEARRDIEGRGVAQPAITIYFFTRGHEGTTTFWKTSPGRLMVKHVCDHLGKKLLKSGYWSGNGVVEVLMDHRLKAKFIKPLAMGLNKHRAAKDCAFIYSAKSTNDDKAVMEVFKLTEDDIRHAREDDAVAQFVMRGALRDGAYDGPYAIYLYSESQAERLRDHLIKIGFTTVELAPVDEAGIMDSKRPKSGRRAPTPEEIQAKERKRLDDDAARKRDERADKAKSEGREPSANEGMGGRPAGSKDKGKRAPRIARTG